MSALAACTIVSKNYIPYARVLAESFREQHPEGQFFVLLVDRNEKKIDPNVEPYTLVEVEELDNIPDRDGFLFKYTILECNTAVKPFLLEYLIERYKLDNLVYFDPDILITGSLAELADLVDKHAIVLTPHLTDPVDDGAHPGELAVLQAGSFNLGFVALGAAGEKRDTVSRLLKWWQDRLYDRCVVRIDEGLFVDQKWMDLTPGLFKDVYVLNDPGYNVAYWNLHGRRITLTPDGPRSNDRPLTFFHFSGIDPENLRPVSKHQDRFVLSDLGGAADLYKLYAEKVLNAGYQETRSWPYVFGFFDNGVRIPNAARAIYMQLGQRQKRRFGDPFRTAGEDSFFHYLNEPRAPGQGPSLSRLLGHLYEQRPDLLRLFPDVDGKDYLDYCGWLLQFGRHELQLDDELLAGVTREGASTALTASGLKRRVTNRMKRAYHSEVGRIARREAKRLVGAERYQSLRNRLRGPRPPSASTAPPLPYRMPVPSAIHNRGVNVVGYLQAETGMGEAARGMARALATTEIPITRHTVDLNVVARKDDDSFNAEISDFRHDVNLFVVNADQIGPVYEHLGPEVFSGRYNIGFWLWELESFPDIWNSSFDVLHEIWTPSSFCADAISRIAPVPVRRVPLPVELEAIPELGRDHFRLPKEPFVFLFMFNFLSYMERKNPLALIRAFKQAFGPRDDVLLVLKTAQSDFAPEARQEIEEEIGRARNIHLLDAYLTRPEITALLNTADAYVSLHRSEGYGLTLAESMLLGKPVVATAYSGNTDFFNLNCGFPVRFSRVQLEEDAGPYPRGAVWADADVGHAAEVMQRVAEQREEDRAIIEAGQREVEERLSCTAVGETIKDAFDAAVGRVDRAQPRWLR